jgi:cell division protein FtsB
MLAGATLALLVAAALLGRGGLVELLRLEREERALGEQAFERLHGNQELRGRIQAVRRSDREIERRARQELGLVRDGEIVYRFAPPVLAARRD